MKEFKKDMENYFYITKEYKYYSINNTYHGFFYSYFNVSQKNISKGFINMGQEYSHWKIFQTSFRYFV